jgi:hypothetical protein
MPDRVCGWFDIDSCGQRTSILFDSGCFALDRILIRSI